MSNLSQSSQTFIEKNSAAEFSCSEPWLNQLRKNGLESFSANGLPTPNIEEWKYTSLKVLEGIGDVNNNALNLAFLPSL